MAKAAPNFIQNTFASVALQEYDLPSFSRTAGNPGAGRFSCLLFTSLLFTRQNSNPIHALFYISCFRENTVTNF